MLLTGQYFGCYRSVPLNLARVRADFHPCPKGHPDESPRAHAGRTSRRSDSPGRDGGRSGGSGCAECDVVRTGPQAAGHPAGRTNTGLRRAGRSAMVNYFIHRPVFASVIAVIMILTGLIAYSLLPVAQFPDITPPQVVVTATYPGASSQVVANTVTTPLEQQINGVPGMAYMSSVSANDGSSNITISFDVGYPNDIAAVDVQNRVSAATAQLPAIVNQGGVTIQKKNPNLTLAVNLYSPDGSVDLVTLSNYAYLQLVDPLKRITGFADVQIFGERRYSMRVW